MQFAKSRGQLAEGSLQNEVCHILQYSKLTIHHSQFHHSQTHNFTIKKYKNASKISK